MALNNHETGSNSSSPFVFLHGGAGMGQMWQPHLAQLSDLRSPFFDLSRQGQEGKKAAVVQVNKIKKLLPIPRRAEPRKMEPCCNATCLATA
jgi:pimeloyl-ACP methyl ester carboxylesterase